MRLVALLALLTLVACVDPHLNAGVSLGAGGASVYPSISTGIKGGGVISYAP